MAGGRTGRGRLAGWRPVGLLLPLLLCLGLVAGCASAAAGDGKAAADKTAASWSFNLTADGSLPVYGRGNGARGELIAALPLGAARPGKVIFDGLGAAATRQALDPVVAGRLQREVLALYPAGDYPRGLVRFYRLQYWTRDLAGRPVAASALLLLPGRPGGTGAGQAATGVGTGQARGLPLLLLAHCTQLWPGAGPSRLNFGENSWAYLLAAAGAAVLAPDYPGYGDSAPFHPYMQADSLGYDCRDALAATLGFMATDQAGGMRLDGRLALGGYSEGGYAVLATLRELARQPLESLRLEAVFPMAAPADVSGAMRQRLTGPDEYPHPFYLPFLLLGWRQQDQVLLAPERLFTPAARRAVLPLFNGSHNSGEIDQAIKTVVGQGGLTDLLAAEVRSWLAAPDQTAEGRQLQALMRANDLMEVPAPPEARMVIVASPVDDAVPFDISRRLAGFYAAQGNPAELVELAPLSHDNAYFEAWAVLFGRLHRLWALD